MVDQEGLQGLAEVLDEMEPIDHLHGIGRAPANAIRVQVAPITADHRNRRMLGEPCRDAGGRAVRQQVDDTMCRQIDEDGAIAMTSPPGPLVYPNDLEGWGVGHRGCPHQPEQGRWTGRELQAGREPGPCLPAQRHANGPEDCHQSMGFASIGRDEFRQALGEDPTPAGPIAAEEFPHGQLDTDGPRTPGKVRQAALIAAMH